MFRTNKQLLYKYLIENSYFIATIYIDPNREYYRPDIFTFSGHDIKFDFRDSSNLDFILINLFQYLWVSICLYFFLVAAQGNLFQTYRIRISESVDLEQAEMVMG